MNSKKPSEADGRQGSNWSKLVRPIHVTVEDEIEFQVAMEAYKQQSGRNFPTWSEILDLLRSLGYSKRIWKPFGTWTPISTEPLTNESGVEYTMSVIGSFSRVETPVGP